MTPGQGEGVILLLAGSPATAAWPRTDISLFQIDFEELANSLVQLERRCRSSWHNLKVIAKHETKPVLKTKLTEFLKDSTQRIIVLKVVHRRVLNRLVVWGNSKNLAVLLVALCD